MSLWFVLAAAAHPWRDEQEAELRLLFTGDILLDRGVRAQIERTGRSPWDGLGMLFRQADLVVGNLEGAVGLRGACTPGAKPCFAVAPKLLGLLARAGFDALGVENNHSGDLGAGGREATRKALDGVGLTALGFQESPHFFRRGDYTIALVAVNQVPAADGGQQAIPSPSLLQKLRLARRLSHLVVVYIHWGAEYLEWPSESQREAAKRLIRQGADLIVGHHPHVIQWPECLLGKPVFYSLGNHVFDQGSRSTKEGLIAECRVAGGFLYAGAILTRTPARSTFPRLVGRPGMADEKLGSCAVPLGRPLRVGGWELRAEPGQRGIRIEGRDGGGRIWRSAPLPLLAIEAGRMGGSKELLFTLERRYSSLDAESGPRPYVYEPGPRGLIARWRGSGLAWPLLDAALLDGETLCALHRADSFLVPNPGASSTRIAAYRWNGFGFSGLNDAALEVRCAELFR